MAKCQDCEKDMSAKETESCTWRGIKIADKIYHRIKYYHDDNERCHDCNIVNGNYHHYGCDMERCPKCKGQLITCGCDIQTLIV